MTEEKNSSGPLLQDEALLRRVLQREPSLVSRIVSHADFLEALFSQPEALRGLMREPLVADDYQFDQLLASMGGDGAILHSLPGREEARLIDLFKDAEALGQLFREHPELTAAVAANPAFVEQVKVRKPQFYKALLEKAQERFSKDAVLVEEIRAQRESLHCFDNEGGKNETEDERREREAREAGQKILQASRESCPEVVRSLLERGADPNLHNNYGETALMYTADRGHADAVRALLEHGADLNLQSKYGKTALMCAASRGHADIVRVLLEGGANPNLQDENGKTALMKATFFGHADTMRALLEGGADPNLQDNNGWTALMCAASRGHADIVRVLLKAGANPNLQDQYGQTARDVTDFWSIYSWSIKGMLKAANRKQGRQGEREQERGR